MSMHNFYLDPDDWQPPFRLSGQEARHLSRVLRLKNGDTVRLLDGNGRTGEFRIDDVGKTCVQLEPLSIQHHPRPPSRCWLAAAYTKAARRSWIMEKAVELEAGGVWFWQSERSQAKLPEEDKGSWREQLIAGAKQSFNPWLPELACIKGGAEALAIEGGRFSSAILLWEEADGEQMLQLGDLEPRGDILFVMGPEGGLTQKEADIFTAHGFKAVSLGKRILRWETAALTCLGLGWWARELAISNSTDKA